MLNMSNVPGNHAAKRLANPTVPRNNFHIVKFNVFLWGINHEPGSLAMLLAIIHLNSVRLL